ncbi:electron transfer flavoprotein subunit alpha [Gluconacetobacter liquefaciens]|uniref:Electron transfer flavoprotein subunit alpha n=1 Tax=Gluconacetobacter liquefaciens TaxID=89584 RepID=A0A370G6D8_GLULI|nr:FAD-binding protein [Gluconacetobacter liquefaciens]MBB2185573.1 electron transfer flavoprotein subunit alpha/FixB family protein [Gluconacetobacter liquefaciens]RDI39378.1 electron transfer flavoprotein alpha subunit apoprotein [Gluconacetobacter liquefaciens]GBQ97419.1 electron transfer flavoprotein subunit alpha [Gluconacetobacter liquefaciens NRIC 0522]GEB36019.1 electron transfer flavoprotein subunit alpha [Gluconacetobacter liquefaciens]
MTTLLIADHDNRMLSDATARALSALGAIDDAVHVLVAGHQAGPVAGQAAKLRGVGRVLLADDEALAHGLAEPVAVLVLSLAGGYRVIAAPATSGGKDVLPRVAALLDVMQVSDVVRVVSPDTFERPVYAGNAVAVVQSTDEKKLLTIRTSAFSAAGVGDVAVPVEEVRVPDGVWQARFDGETLSSSDRPDLASARIVVSGGRALGSAEKFQEVLGPLAERLHAAIGASRAAVDAGYAANDLQVGQTGKVVAPDLYIALGISGAIQHLAGMKDAKVIVAINKDEDAPIFQVADYGIVGDLFEIVPELEKALG